MFLTIVAALLAQPSAPTLVSPPPMFIPTPQRAEAAAEIKRIEVEVAAAGKTLWQGVLRVATSQPGSYNQHLQQAAERAADCSPEQAMRSSRDQLSVTLNPWRHSNQETDLVHVSASWTRSVRPVTCGSQEAPSRTVSVNEMVKLLPEKPVQISGDAGLTVTLKLLER